MKWLSSLSKTILYCNALAPTRSSALVAIHRAHLLRVALLAAEAALALRARRRRSGRRGAAPTPATAAGAATGARAAAAFASALASAAFASATVVGAVPRPVARHPALEAVAAATAAAAASPASGATPFFFAADSGHVSFASISSLNTGERCTVLFCVSKLRGIF